MYRAIIFDNLMECSKRTIPCATEEAAKAEGKAAIARLCKKCHVAETDGRFFVYGIEL